MMKKTILAGLISAIVTSASAVEVNTNGDGEVLLSPYYTVQNGQNTYISIVNTTDNSKAIKVRFRESYNSRDVLDFNLYMSPYDVWTAGIVPTKAGGAKLITNDTSCTVPTIPQDGVEFRPYAYDGTTLPVDGAPTDITRTAEGHFELIEMGVADQANLGVWDANGNGVSDVTHDANGVPENCQTMTSNWEKTGGWFLNNHANMLAPTGGLFGSVHIINVGTGTDFSVPVTALDNFSNVSIHSNPGTLQPNLSNATPISKVLHDGVTYVDTWTNGIDAVSAVLMRNSFGEQYTVNSAVDASTSWVVTFPTKTEYVDTAKHNAPFTEDFNGKSCDSSINVIFDREEAHTVVDNGIDFSPMPTADRLEFCYETNVINFNGVSAFGAENTNIDVDVDTFRNGWMVIGFSEYNQALTGSTNTYKGLPVIGFKASKLGNKNVGVGASYASASAFKYSRLISGK
jgi:hypothetical protein